MLGITERRLCFYHVGCFVFGSLLGMVFFFSLLMLVSFSCVTLLSFQNLFSSCWVLAKTLYCLCVRCFVAKHSMRQICLFVWAFLVGTFAIFMQNSTKKAHTKLEALDFKDTHARTHKSRTHIILRGNCVFIMFLFYKSSL